LEDDFEELYDMYGENMKMHPMVRIPMRTCMMIYMVHLTNQMTRKAPIPNIDEIMRQNPDIARQLASAAMQNQSQTMRGSAQVPMPTQQQAPSNPLSGLMSFMQGATVQAPPPPVLNVIPRQPSESKPIQIGIKKAVAKPVTIAPPVQMKAPVNIEDLLKDIKQTIVPPAGNGPPPPEKVKKGSGKAGSTGKNSVVIKL
jgi:hypothetical protein